MVMNRFRRKAIFVERNILYTDVAKAVSCDLSTVSRIASGLTVRDTRKALRVKEELARRAGMRVDELWPVAEPSAANHVRVAS